MIITKETLELGKSVNGSWSDKQLRLLGVKTTMFNPGWKQRLLGSDVSLENVKQFIILKNSHIKNRQENSLFA